MENVYLFFVSIKCKKGLIWLIINPFVLNAFFLYLLKTPLPTSLQGLEKGCIGSERVKVNSVEIFIGLVFGNDLLKIFFSITKGKALFGHSLKYF